MRKFSQFSWPQIAKLNITNTEAAQRFNAVAKGGAHAADLDVTDMPDGTKMVTGGPRHGGDYPPDPNHCPICKFMVEGDGSAEGLKEAFRKAKEQGEDRNDGEES